MELSYAIQRRIIDLCNSQNISITKLANNSGLPFSTIFSIFYGKSKNPRLSTLLHICEGLNINLCDFFNDPVFNDVKFEEKE